MEPLSAEKKSVTARDPGIATVLSFYSIGLGHLYAGRFFRAFVIMAAYPLAALAYFIGVLRFCNLYAPEGTGGRWFLGLFALGIVLGWVFVVLVAIDAKRCAERTNAGRH